MVDYYPYTLILDNVASDGTIEIPLNASAHISAGKATNAVERMTYAFLTGLIRVKDRYNDEKAKMLRELENEVFGYVSPDILCGGEVNDDRLSFLIDCLPSDMKDTYKRRMSRIMAMPFDRAYIMMALKIAFQAELAGELQAIGTREDTGHMELKQGDSTVIRLDVSGSILDSSYIDVGEVRRIPFSDAFLIDSLMPVQWLMSKRSEVDSSIDCITDHLTHMSRAIHYPIEEDSLIEQLLWEKTAQDAISFLDELFPQTIRMPDGLYSDMCISPLETTGKKKLLNFPRDECFFAMLKLLMKSHQPMQKSCLILDMPFLNSIGVARDTANRLVNKLRDTGIQVCSFD